MAKPKLEFALVCDDVRQEIGNKVSYIGVYGHSPKIFIPKLPHTFPKLCFILAFKNLKKGIPFKIIVQNPSGKKNVAVKDGIVPQDVQSKMTFFGVFSPLQIKMEGVHKVNVVFDEDEKTAQGLEFDITLSGNPPK